MSRVESSGLQIYLRHSFAGKISTCKASKFVQLGFPIETVITVDHSKSAVSSKAEIINSLKPFAFVDGYAPYMVGIRAEIHKALVTRETEGSPNTGELLNAVSSQHTDLKDFANYWLGA